jgi:hypothetical protein
MNVSVLQDWKNSERQSMAKKNREFLLPVSTRFLEKEVVKTARLSGYPE